MKEPLELFFILGYIDNYTGGFSSEHDVFQVIGKSAHPKAFEKLKEKSIACIQGLNCKDDLTIKTENGYTQFSSKVICQAIDRICEAKNYIFSRDYFFLSEKIFSTIKTNFPEDGDTGTLQRVEFLKGVFLNHWNEEEQSLYLYNDYNKSSLTHRCLHILAEEEDEITWKSYYLTPNTCKISVRASSSKFLMDIVGQHPKSST